MTLRPTEIDVRSMDQLAAAAATLSMPVDDSAEVEMTPSAKMQGPQHRVAEDGMALEVRELDGGVISGQS